MKGRQLTEEVHRIIRENWPIHPSDVCRKIGLELTVSNISKIQYHFKILHEKKKVRLKKIDRALVAWPYEIERLRIIHDFVRDME